MKKGRFDTAKLAEWTKKVGTKIKETAEALEVEFNDDGTGGGEHAKHSIKGQSMMQQNSLNNRFAALRTNSPLSSASHSQSSFVEDEDKDDAHVPVNVVLNVSETSDVLEQKMRLEKELNELHKEREEEKRKREEEFERKMKEMEKKLEEEIKKNKNAAAATANARVVCDTPTTPKKSNKKKKTDDDAPAAASPSSLEIELKAIKNVTQTLKNQLKERDERIAKMSTSEKERKEQIEILTQKNQQMQSSLDVLRKKQKENDAAKDKEMLETSELKDIKRMKEKQEKELEREKKTKEEVQKKYEKAHKDWLDLTTNQAKEKKDLLRLQKSEEVKTEKIEKLEEQLLQTKLELEDFKHCKKERDDALQKLSEVREENVDLKHEKSAYENNAEDLRLVNEAREVAEKALVEESKKTIELERKLRELSEEKVNSSNNTNTDSTDSNNNRTTTTTTKKKKKNTTNDDPESASGTPKKGSKGKATPFRKNEETGRDGETTKAAHTNESLSSPSTIAELKSEIAALKCQLETLSREKDDKIAVIDSDRAQLQRQLEEAKKTATKLIREKLESLQKDIKCSAETHAKETGLLKEEISDLEEDRNEWKRKCEKARDETDLVRKRAREMLVEKEEELERALLHYKHDGKLLSSSNGRKASSLTFLDDDDVDNNATSKPPPAPSSTTTPNDNDFLYLKNILLQYLSTNERLVHERLVPVVTTLLKCSDEERAKVIAARVNMKPSSSSGIGSQPNTPTRGGGIRLLNSFFNIRT